MAAETATPARPRRERAENAAMRRRQILDATLRSIEKNGLAGTTLATVSREAGLSQGVAVFYFRNKQGLLEAALRKLYGEYDACWRAALERAGPDPARRLAALVLAEFEPATCTPETLAVWLAYQGEAAARPLYAAISQEFDAAHTAAMETAIRGVTGDPDAASVLATAITATTDGLWITMRLDPGFGRGDALAALERMLTALFPDHAATIRQAFAEEGDG